MAEVVGQQIAITVTPSNTAIPYEHTVNHIFQYPNGEVVHQVIKNLRTSKKSKIM